MEKRLYRDPVEGKIAGVCAGIAEYLTIEIWIVRILFVTIFLLGLGFFAVVAYIAAILMIEKKPPNHMFYAAGHKIKQTPWQQGKSAHALLSDLEFDIMQLEKKVASMESLVTSREFELNRQFKHL